ncbi:NADH dehydrogenase [ubiquinone] 1 subunit C2 isoform X2 [Eleutherodactylus coqui]|uniref:NADH dehydrogenase [ubiquinone] 1 subunit C2 n=1 Tax=Eleutherodactylus coqui TaxID=57060 RepID=A0A8J6EPX3_ELECQ|nr:hypothetical protein GDO78_022391 [Eleutherodactylus coqui]
MGLMPDEARSLPPPSVVNRNSLYLGFLGVHRQILYTTVGIFIGYHLTKYENYKYAKRDRELFDYLKRHPEIVPQKENRPMAEVYEKFYPVR